jgi:UDP-2-acetamido-3-amino-2,3-dideoxy-glucuronate N-acetyltransferase|tara:strand:+ start:754 stop:1329 length:576 start_codon:yes stop_codon:yes gene_type:complete
MTSNSSNFIHESSYVDDDVKIGEGTKIWHFSHIQSGARIGRDCTIGQNVNIGNNVVIGNKVKIQNNVSIYEGIELEDYVFCGPSAVFTNIKKPRSEFPQKGSNFYEKTLVKKSVTLGANCTILCGITLGEYAFVGAGAMVTKDVAPHSLMKGSPAKRVCWVGFKGEKLSFGKDGISSCKKFKQKGNKLFCL